MVRTLISETIKKVGEKVEIDGWVRSIRKHGKIMFVDIRDRSGVLQVVIEAGSKAYEAAVSANTEDVVKITGEISKRDEKFVNPNMPSGKVEMQADNFEVIVKAEKMPFDIEKENLDVNLDTLLDFRTLTLRHPKIQAIFKVQAEIARSFRRTLTDEGFLEFFGPTIVASATEGGAEVFRVDYYGHDAYLAQSPQLYKQILVSGFERVFTIAHAYRAEPSMTTRHLSEYVGLDAEMGFINDFKDITRVVAKAIKNIFKDISENCSTELKMYNTSVPDISKEIPMVKLKEAQEIIFKRTGKNHRNDPDLAPEDEREISKYAKEKFGSDLIFVTHYPTSKRPFYTYPDPEDTEYTCSFDLIGRGVEWVTGGQRINDYDKLVSNIKKRGMNPDNFKMYLAAFEFGMPAEGGFCIGLERITQHILGLSSVKEASLFPRDMERVDGKLAKMQGKKKI